MNNTKVLTTDAARTYLWASWNDEMVLRAFSERWTPSLGNAVRLMNPDAQGQADLAELFDLYDAAGMLKTEVIYGIWQAARRYYEGLA